MTRDGVRVNVALHLAKVGEKYESYPQGLRMLCFCGRLSINGVLSRAPVWSISEKRSLVGRKHTIVRDARKM